MKFFKNSVIQVLGASLMMMTITSTAVAKESTFDIEAAKAKYSVRDYVYKPMPKRGYDYYKIAENAYFVHDEFEHMVFFVTDIGVVVYDAMPDVSPHVLKVIKEVTDKPITHVIYSHHHADHARGMTLFPKTAIKISNDETDRLLKEANDPLRPRADIVWKDSYVLETGGLRLEFKDYDKNWHSHADSIAYAPKQKILLATDTFHADAAPWLHFGEAVNAKMTFKLPEVLLKDYPDFEFILNGHERIVPTRAHFEVYKEIIEDMKSIVYEVAKSKEFHAMMAETMKRYADGSEHWIYKEAISTAAKLCADKFYERWVHKVRNVRLNMEENFAMMWMQLIVLNPDQPVKNAY